LAHRHAVTETKKRVERQTRQYKRQQTSSRVIKIKAEQKIKTCTKTVTNTEKKIKELREKKVVIKSESEKTKIEDEITSLETTIETEKAIIKTENTKKVKAEDDEAIVTTKITESQEVVKRVEKETERIEQEAKTIETSFTSETTVKVSKEVKKRTKETRERRRKALKQKIKNLKKVIKTKKEKITTQTKKIVESTKKITESSNKITRVTEIRDRQTRVSKYAGCQRLLVEQPTFFEMTTICAAAVSRLAQLSTSVSTSTTITTTSASSVVVPSSSTCQICYSQNTACNGGGSLSGISVVSFAVDTQGEAESIVSQLFGESLVGDVNFVLGQVNPKYQVFGQPITTSSQTKVELVTADGKVQQVVAMVNNWLMSHGKAVTSKSSEAQVTALTGGSNNYIQTIMKATGTYQTGTPQLRSAVQSRVQKEEDDKPTLGTNIESFIARVYE
jgi:myosin heavy subunit